jgi:hypothetical protein
MKAFPFSLLAGLALALSAGAAAGALHDTKAFADTIQAAIEKGVGAKASDRILGGYGYRNGNPRANLPSNKSGDSFQAGGIECPESISDVKQATELVTTNLKSTFTNRISSIDSRINQQGGDTILTMEIINKDDPFTISVTISIFKRPQSRVIILPNYFVQYSGGVG